MRMAAVQPSNPIPVKPFGIGTTVVAEQSDRLSLPQLQPLRTIRPIVNPRSISTVGDVAGQFVEFSPQGELFPPRRNFRYSGPARLTKHPNKLCRFGFGNR